MTSETNTNENTISGQVDKDLVREVHRLSSELSTLRENIQKRKRENTALKVLLYTGFALLLIGFIYSNTTLQRVQLQNLEGNVRSFHRQIQRDITLLELNLLDHSRKAVQEELAIRDASKPGEKETNQSAVIRSTLSALSELVSSLAKNNPELQDKLNFLNSKSDALLQTLNGSEAIGEENMKSNNSKN